MTLGKIVSPGFQHSLTSLLKIKLPVKASWKLRKIAKVIEGEITNYNASRKELIDKYSSKKEDGSPEVKGEGPSANYVFSDENMALFKKEIEELNGIEVEIDRIKISDLGGIEIEPSVLILLDDLIED